MQSSRPSDLSPNPVTSAPAPGQGRTTGNADVDRSTRDYVDATNVCNTTVESIPWEENTINARAARGKTWGLLITTVAGVGGSVATAALSDSNKNTGNTPPTVAGAITAGVTAVAGVVSLFAIGSGSDGQIKAMNDSKPDLDTAQAALDKACAQVGTDANQAKACSAQAAIISAKCKAIGSHYPIALAYPPPWHGGVFAAVAENSGSTDTVPKASPPVAPAMAPPAAPAAPPTAAPPSSPVGPPH